MSSAIRAVNLIQEPAPLLVGERAAVKWLMAQLESRGTAAHLLPSGIPYHTPLVSSSMGSGAAAMSALRSAGSWLRAG